MLCLAAGTSASGQAIAPFLALKRLAPPGVDTQAPLPTDMHPANDRPLRIAVTLLQERLEEDVDLTTGELTAEQQIADNPRNELAGRYHGDRSTAFAITLEELKQIADLTQQLRDGQWTDVNRHLRQQAVALSHEAHLLTKAKREVVRALITKQNADRQYRASSEIKQADAAAAAAQAIDATRPKAEQRVADATSLLQRTVSLIDAGGTALPAQDVKQLAVIHAARMIDVLDESLAASQKSTDSFDRRRRTAKGEIKDLLEARYALWQPRLADIQTMLDRVEASAKMSPDRRLRLLDVIDLWHGFDEDLTSYADSVIRNTREIDRIEPQVEQLREKAASLMAEWNFRAKPGDAKAPSPRPFAALADGALREEMSQTIPAAGEQGEILAELQRVVPYERSRLLDTRERRRQVDLAVQSMLQAPSPSQPQNPQPSSASKSNAFALLKHHAALIDSQIGRLLLRPIARAKYLHYMLEISPQQIADTTTEGTSARRTQEASLELAAYEVRIREHTIDCLAAAQQLLADVLNTPDADARDADKLEVMTQRVQLAANVLEIEDFLHTFRIWQLNLRGGEYVARHMARADDPTTVDWVIGRVEGHSKVKFFTAMSVYASDSVRQSARR